MTTNDSEHPKSKEKGDFNPLPLGLDAKSREHHGMQSQVGDPVNWPETWSVQLFRSIDSSSAADLPKTQDALKMGLSAQKGKIVEFSIQVPCIVCCPLQVSCCKTFSACIHAVYCRMILSLVPAALRDSFCLSSVGSATGSAHRALCAVMNNASIPIQRLSVA